MTLDTDDRLSPTERAFREYAEEEPDPMRERMMWMVYQDDTIELPDYVDYWDGDELVIQEVGDGSRTLACDTVVEVER